MIALLKRHPSLIPLVACVVTGGCGAIGYSLRLALKNPDVAWRVKDNPLPNSAYENKRYQFYSPHGKDVVSCPAPKY